MSSKNGGYEPMLFDRLRYEWRITGWWTFLTPLALMLCLLPLTFVLVHLRADHLRISQVLTSSLEMLLPVATGLLVANLVGHDAALELHLTFPARYRLTLVLRVTLVVLWSALIALLGSAVIYHLRYLRIPEQLFGLQVLPQFLTWQLAWLAPLCWFVALGACFSLLMRSRAASSALLGGIWMLEAVFYGYFALLNGLKPFFLFPTTLAPAISFWLPNRWGLLAIALAVCLLTWFLLSNSEALLRGASGGE